jgi:REP element-mobilizing transposase RayT
MKKLTPQPHQKSLREGRYVEAGNYYFITTNTQGREKTFLHTQAAKIVLDALKWLNDNNRIVLIAAMVMPDHLHFVIELKDESLSKVMHSLKSFTANQINEVLGRNGHLWEKQYYEHGIRDEKALMDMVKYCLENPVRRGLVSDFKGYPYWYCIYEV